MVRVMISFVIVVCLVSVGYTLDLNGEWEGNYLSLKGDTTEVLFSLIQDSSNLTGSFQLSTTKYSILKGTIKDKMISFSVMMDKTLKSNQGIYSDGTISLKLNGGKTEVSLTRKPTENINGQWLYKFKGMNDEEVEITFILKVDGDKLTGSSKSQFGDMTLSNGKVYGNKFSFDVANDQFTIHHDCTISGDTIKMKVSGFGDGGESRENIVTRIKQ